MNPAMQMPMMPQMMNMMPQMGMMNMMPQMGMNQMGMNQMGMNQMGMMPQMGMNMMGMMPQMGMMPMPMMMCEMTCTMTANGMMCEMKPAAGMDMAMFTEACKRMMSMMEAGMPMMMNCGGMMMMCSMPMSA
ncbi:hypothetical protein [Devosia sp. 2618]|uniref:hypothetical protein n=1 Tax=Devosia sp. 2618 TaxID=3156454 RepID=UPI003393EF4A